MGQVHIKDKRKYRAVKFDSLSVGEIFAWSRNYNELNHVLIKIDESSNDSNYGRAIDLADGMRYTVYNGADVVLIKTTISVVREDKPSRFKDLSIGEPCIADDGTIKIKKNDPYGLFGCGSATDINTGLSFMYAPDEIVTPVTIKIEAEEK